MFGPRVQRADGWLVDRGFGEAHPPARAVVPFNALNYAAGLTGVTPGAYVTATVLGIICCGHLRPPQPNQYKPEQNTGGRQGPRETWPFFPRRAHVVGSVRTQGTGELGDACVNGSRCRAGTPPR